MQRSHVHDRVGGESSIDLVARLVPSSVGVHVHTAGHHAERIAMHGALGHGLLPTAGVFEDVLPAGALERGRIYGCAGDASLSMLFAMVAPATRRGSWFAMVDMPHAGLQSAREHGVALHRTVCASSGAPAAWPLVVGALVDGIDMVAIASPTCRATEARRLAARVKASGAVLFIVGQAGAFEPDVVLHSRTVWWNFDLHAHSRRVNVSVAGRRVHSQRTTLVHLPGARGCIDAADNHAAGTA